MAPSRALPQPRTELASPRHWDAATRIRNSTRVHFEAAYFVAVKPNSYPAADSFPVVLVQLEDLVLQLDQANLPGTSHERPNWRHRLAMTIEELFAQPHTRALVAAMNEARE